MSDYFLVQFAKEIGKKTSQLTLSDMLKFNRWRVPESTETISEEKKKEDGYGYRFTRTNSSLK